MANRHLLHRSKLEAFKDWLTADGWTIEPGKGFFQALQARKPGCRAPLVVFDRFGGDHLSLMDRDCSVVRAFIRGRKEGC